MAGTPKNYDNTRTVWGHADIWIDCAMPAAGAKPTLHTDGTPDATANPNAKHVGYLRPNTKWTYKSTKVDARDYQHTAPHRSKRGEESMRVESRWLQVLDADLLSGIVDGVTVTDVSDGTLVEAGGKRDIATTCVYIIAQRADVAGKYICIVILAALFTEGLEVTFDPEGENDSPLGIDAQAVPSRAEGRQLGQFYIQDSA